MPEQMVQDTAWTAPCSIQDVIAERPQIHGQGTCGIEQAVIDELQNRITPGIRTMEIGAGLSTFVFALAGSHHVVITPSSEEVQRIRDLCARMRIPLDRIEFIIEPSHVALPGQPPQSFDLIFIDGCHGIPMVQVDYLYSALALKSGGTLVLDDVQLWPVKELLDFLKGETSWRYDGTFGKTAFLTKLNSCSEILEWDTQPYTVARTKALPQNWRVTEYLLQLGRVGRSMARGDFRAVWHKVLRRIRREQAVP